MINVSLHWEDMTILNVYTDNNKTATTTTKKLVELKEKKIDKSMCIVGNSTTPSLHVIELLDIKIIEGIEKLNNTGPKRFYSYI